MFTVNAYKYILELVLLCRGLRCAALWLVAQAATGFSF